MSNLNNAAITNDYYERTLENTDKWVDSLCREHLKSDVEITTLKQFILQELPTLQEADLNEKYFKKILWKKFSNNYRKLLTATKRQAKVKAAFCGAIIREFALRAEKEKSSFSHHRSRLLELFPNFQLLNEIDIILLTRFYRGVTIASNFIKGKQNKNLFMEIGTLLECSGKRYVTGGDCTITTKRRLSIYKIVTNSGVSLCDHNEDESSSEEEQFGAFGDDHSLSDLSSTKRQKLDHEFNQLFANRDTFTNNASSLNNPLLNFNALEAVVRSDTTNGLQDDADVWDGLLAGEDFFSKF